jgi:hypothetical protein
MKLHGGPRMRRRLFAVALMGLTATATGCADVGLAPRVPVVQDWTSLPSVPANVVSAAHQDLKATLGVQVVWQSDTPTPETKAEANQIFNYVVGLGANEVGLDFYFDTNGSHPNRVYGEPGITPSPYTIALLVGLAQQRGLRVMLRPLLSENNLGIAAGNWRGNIQPKSVKAWFASYYAFLHPYLTVAQEDHISNFAIGTELDSLASAKKQWAALEAKVKYVYSGPLTFAVNWNDWHTTSTKYKPVPHVAVDAYPPTTLRKDATVPQLTAAWVKWLNRQPEKNLRQTVIQEVGIAPADGAYANPAGYGAAEPVVNADIQRNWFAAACKAAKKTHLAGMFYYVVYNTDAPGEPASLLDATRTLSFTGVSDSVVKTCFASGWF